MVAPIIHTRVDIWCIQVETAKKNHKNPKTKNTQYSLKGVKFSLVLTWSKFIWMNTCHSMRFN